MEWATGQGEVADGIEHLVADALVGPAELRADRALGREHDKVSRGDGGAEPGRPEPGRIVGRDERPRGGELAAVGGGSNVDVEALLADRPGAVIEEIVDRQAGEPGGPGLDPADRIADADGFGDGDRIDRGVLLDDPGPIDRRDEIARRAIHAGQLLGADDDRTVVDAQASQGAHDMLDEVNARRTADDLGAVAGLDHRSDDRRHRGRRSKITANEHDPAADGGGVELDTILAAAPVAPPVDVSRGAEGALRPRGWGSGHGRCRGSGWRVDPRPRGRQRGRPRGSRISGCGAAPRPAASPRPGC